MMSAISDLAALPLVGFGSDGLGRGSGFGFALRGGRTAARRFAKNASASACSDASSLSAWRRDFDAGFESPYLPRTW